MNVKLSNGMTVTTSNVALDSALVLIGRGLTDWLLTKSIAEKRHFYPVAHSVPSLAEATFDTRTVYARMKVPPPSATTAMSGCLDFEDTEMTFQEFFRHKNYPSPPESRSNYRSSKKTNEAG